MNPPAAEIKAVARRRPGWGWVAGFGLAYFGCAAVGHLLAVRPETVVNFWLPSGLFVAALLLTEGRQWPGLVLAAALANVSFDLLLHGQPLPISLLIGGGNCLEAVAGAWLVRRWVAERPTLQSVREVSGLTLWSALLSTCLSPTVGAVLLSRQAGGGPFAEVWLLWWSGHALGILLMAPLVLAWGPDWRSARAWMRPGPALQAGLLLTGLAASTVFVFHDPWHPGLALKYALIPCVGWAVFRFGLRGATLASLVVAVVASWMTARGYGDISASGLLPRDQTTALRFYLAVVAWCGLVLAGLLAERRRAEAEARANEAVLRESLLFLQQSERRFRSLYESMMDAYVSVAMDGRIQEFNSAFRHLLGYTGEELRQLTHEDLTPSRWHPFEAQIVRDQILLRGYSEVYEKEYRRKDGTVFPIELRTTLRTDDAGEPVGMWAIIRDITPHKRSQAALQRVAQEWQTTFDAVGSAVWLLDKDSRIMRSNRAAALLFQRPLAEMLGRHCWEVVHGTRAPIAECPILRARKTLRREKSTLELGGRWLEVVVDPVLDELGQMDGAVHLVEDITERRQAQQALEAALHEKEALLKEIHHRVKNNLQIVSSLLNLQANRANDPGLRAALTDTQNRVRSMALLHEAIYRFGNLAEVDLAAYTERLVAQVVRSLTEAAGRVQVHCRLAPVRLPIEQAIPCGLIINELLTNSLKHAFPGQRPGAVTIELAVLDSADIRLRVVDDGVGVPSGLDLAQLRSLGLQLVSDLTSQLRGRWSLEGGTGTAFTITFPVVSRD